MAHETDFTPLLDSPRTLEKIAHARRLQADALGRKRAADDACNSWALARATRRDTIGRQLALSNGGPRRAENHADLLNELTQLNDGERGFQKTLTEDRQRADAEYQRASAPAVSAMDWLAERHADWRAAGKPDRPWLRHVAPSLKGKKPSADLVRELRDEIAAIEDQALDVSRRPATAAELKARVDAALTEVSAPGQLTLDPRERHADPFGLLDALTRRHLYLGSPRGTVAGASAVLLALFEAELRQHLHELVDGADLTGAMSGEAQERELTRLANKRLHLERLEEAAIVALEADGLSMPRRPDVDPRAFLEIEEAR